MAGVDMLWAMFSGHRMADKARPAHFTATVTIEGPAEEVLADVQRLRGGTRRVLIEARVPSRGYPGYQDRMLPEIKGGQTQKAMELLELLHKQTIIDEDTDRRLARLIEDFGEFTK